MSYSSDPYGARPLGMPANVVTSAVYLIPRGGNL